jgi:hypothetical protein
MSLIYRYGTSELRGQIPEVRWTILQYVYIHPFTQRLLFAGLWFGWYATLFSFNGAKAIYVQSLFISRDRLLQIYEVYFNRFFVAWQPFDA